MRVYVIPYFLLGLATQEFDDSWEMTAELLKPYIQ